ncbi:MAG: cupin domain-containing protein [Solirubrobacteraceae bacterium]
MSEGTRAVVVGPNDGTRIEGPVGGPLVFKVRGDQTDGALTALENVIPPGQGPPLHTHAHEDESWYVIDGELRFRLGGDLQRAPAGSFVFVPRGTPHCFQNIGDTPARILVMFTPSGMERFFDQFAALSAPEPEAFRSIGSPLGMDVIGPPLAQSDPV